MYKINASGKHVLKIDAGRYAFASEISIWSKRNETNDDDDERRREKFEKKNETHLQIHLLQLSLHRSVYLYFL